MVEEEDGNVPYDGEQYDDGALTPRVRGEVENPEESEENMQEYRNNNQPRSPLHSPPRSPPRSPSQLQHHHQRPAMAPRPDTAGELRRRLTAPMVINNIDEPIENLVVGAAMQTYVDDNDTNATTETAFDVFMSVQIDVSSDRIPEARGCPHCTSLRSHTTSVLALLDVA